MILQLEQLRNVDFESFAMMRTYTIVNINLDNLLYKKYEFLSNENFEFYLFRYISKISNILKI